jgi:multiple sugar transport system permease protein
VIPDVAYALIALWIFNPLYGPLNLILRGLGLPAPEWLINPDTAKLVFVIMSLFQIGEAFVILLIGLQDIPPEVSAAAAVDGSSARQTVQHITLPLLLPWIALVTFRAVIVSFQWTFTPSLIMTGGDPYYATLFMPLIIYEEAFDRLRFGPGAAMMLIVVVMTLYFISTLYVLFRTEVTATNAISVDPAPQPADRHRRAVRAAARVDDRRLAAPAWPAPASIDRTGAQPDRARQLCAGFRSAAVWPLLY